MDSREELIRRLDKLVEAISKTGMSRSEKIRAVVIDNSRAGDVQLDVEELNNYLSIKDRERCFE